MGNYKDGEPTAFVLSQWEARLGPHRGTQACGPRRAAWSTNQRGVVAKVSGLAIPSNAVQCSPTAWRQLTCSGFPPLPQPNLPGLAAQGAALTLPTPLQVSTCRESRDTWPARGIAVPGSSQDRCCGVLFFVSPVSSCNSGEERA